MHGGTGVCTQDAAMTAEGNDNDAWLANEVATPTTAAPAPRTGTGESESPRAATKRKKGPMDPDPLQERARE